MHLKSIDRCLLHTFSPFLPVSSASDVLQWLPQELCVQENGSVKLPKTLVLQCVAATWTCPWVASHPVIGIRSSF